MPRGLSLGSCFNAWTFSIAFGFRKSAPIAYELSVGYITNSPCLRKEIAYLI